MIKEFEIFIFGVLSYYLRMKFADTKKYVEEVVRRLIMFNCNHVATPIETSLKIVNDSVEKLVASLRYL